MKTIKYFLLFTLGLFITTSCDTNDDGFYNTIYLHSSNLIATETQPSYSVGDNLYINANFSRYQEETGQTEPLDIYKTTGNAEEFNFSYVLERKNGADWELVEITTSQLDIIKGNAVSGAYVFGSAIYNPNNENYEYRVGMPLAQAGEYRLSYGYNSGSNEVELISKSTGLNLSMTIFSSTNSINSEGYYLFTVN
ncbi:MAG: hypothetical protein ABWZ56_00575 [Flavobacterium sp.]